MTSPLPSANPQPAIRPQPGDGAKKGAQPPVSGTRDRFAAVFGDVAQHADAAAVSAGGTTQVGHPEEGSEDGHRPGHPGTQISEADATATPDAPPLAPAALALPGLILGPAAPGTPDPAASADSSEGGANSRTAFAEPAAVEPITLGMGRIKAYVITQSTHFQPVKTPSALVDRGEGAEPSASPEAAVEASRGPHVSATALGAAAAMGAAAGNAIFVRPVVSRSASPGSTTDADAAPTPADPEPGGIGAVGSPATSGISSGEGHPDRDAGNAHADPPAARRHAGAADGDRASSAAAGIDASGAGSAAPPVSPQMLRVADAIKAAVAAPSPTAAASVVDAASPVRVLTIALHPAEFGVVTVRLRLAGRALSVALTANRPATARLLGRETAALRDLLSADGHDADITGVATAAASRPWSSPVPSAGNSPPAGPAPSGGGQGEPWPGAHGGAGGRSAWGAPRQHSQPKEEDGDPAPRQPSGNIYI